MMGTKLRTFAPQIILDQHIRCIYGLSTLADEICCPDKKNVIEKQLLKEKPMSCALFWSSFFSRGAKIRWINETNVSQ